MSSKSDRLIHNPQNLDAKVFKKRQALANKIAKEHYNITLNGDRSINYIWYLYSEGVKKDLYKDFIFAYELNLLLNLDIITSSEKYNIKTMLVSEDSDNIYMAVLAIENFRKQRIKIHGEWKSIENVSEKFKEISSTYTKILNP